jgi:hypothetical protein
MRLRSSDLEDGLLGLINEGARQGCAEEDLVQHWNWRKRNDVVRKGEHADAWQFAADGR